MHIKFVIIEFYIPQFEVAPHRVMTCLVFSYLLSLSSSSSTNPSTCFHLKIYQFTLAFEVLLVKLSLSIFASHEFSLEL